MTTIGIVEDDRLLNEALARMLEKKGYQPLRAYTLEEGLKLIRQKPELIILDINLPDGEGTRICQAAREYSRIPVLFLTARDEEEDMLRAFDLGADDYLVKPFSFSELLARIRVLLRRSVSAEKLPVLTIGDLSLDVTSHKAIRGGRRIELSSKEYSILEYMMRNEGVVLSRESIREHIWSWDYDGESNVVDVYIRYLRKKIDDGENVKLIHTIRGSGYMIGGDVE